METSSVNTTNASNYIPQTTPTPSPIIITQETNNLETESVPIEPNEIKPKSADVKQTPAEETKA